MHIDSSKAQQQDLTYRPLGESVLPTLEWARSLPKDHNWRAGISREWEKKILAAWSNA